MNNRAVLAGISLMVFCTMVLLCVGSAAGAGAEALAVPRTAAGRQLAGWLKAFNSGNLDTLRRFTQAHFTAAALQQSSAAERAARGAALYRDARELSVERIERSGEHEIAVLAQARLTEEWFRIELQVAEPPPHAITQLSVRLTPRPADAAPRVKMSDAQIAATLDAYVKKLAAADIFSGAVLVAREGKPIYRKAFGLASQAFRAPNRIDTKFNLGSMNKMFTAVAIAQLAEKGRLSFSDTVGKHLPEYPNKPVAEQVTIHHLLTHTSGMGSYFNPKFMEASRDRFRSVADYLPLYVDEPLAFEPGARWEYSNAGFMLLGAIIEKVSGKSYFDYVREQIYRPAGMKDTDSYEMDQDTPNLAIGYTRMGPDGPGSSGPRRNNLYMHVIKGGPAGGGFSTVEDLARFATALREHRLISSQSTETVLAGKVALPGRSEGKYAYGFFDERVNGKRVVGHGGGFPGINSQLDIYPELGYTVAVMSNYDPPAAQRVAGRLREMITQG